MDEPTTVEHVLGPASQFSPGAAQVLQLRPDLKVLYISGYAADEIQLQDLKHRRTSFLGKPFKQDQLARRIRELLDRAP